MNLWRRTKLFFNQWRTFQAKCGHETKLKGTLTAFGETTSGVIQPNADGSIEFCHACLEATVIPCAWCQKPIWPYYPITLYSPRDPNFKPPEKSVVYSHDPLLLVGCLRWECADGGVDRAGFWMPPGYVQRVMSPLELCIAKDDVVIVNDLGNIDEAIKSTQACLEK